MSWQRVRPLALGVPFRGEEVLVAAYDPDAVESFYRPIGGGVEFGESSREAVVREFQEELGLSVTPVEFLGTLENRFEFSGEAGHEIVLVHEVAFEDGRVADRDRYEGTDEGGVTYGARWATVDELVASEAPLYPDGVATVLRGDAHHVVA